MSLTPAVKPFVASPEPINTAPSANSLVRERLARALADVNEVVLDKPQQIKLAFASMLTGGHVLLEDLPGMGKTMLARALAGTMSLDTKRVQFTSDLMPADILGVSIYHQDTKSFALNPGPVFTNILLADEINRAPPRTQSALLEAMAEKQVSIDQKTLKLPDPFLVLATQNPLDKNGTFALPAAQRDRFLFCLSLGYPSRDSELDLMRGRDRQHLLAQKAAAPALGIDDLKTLRQLMHMVHVNEPLLDYAYRLVEATRTHPEIAQGLSPRASLALVQAIKALALMDQRAYAIPEDVHQVFGPLAIHRIELKDKSAAHIQSVLTGILNQTPAP